MIILGIELFFIVLLHLLWNGAMHLQPDEDDEVIEKWFLLWSFTIYAGTAFAVFLYYAY